MSVETITLPVTACMQKQPDGHYRMTAAEYAAVPLDIVARLFWQAYQADRNKIQNNEGKELT